MNDEQRPAELALRNFLQELAALTEKYAYEIGGCGECGSPWIEDIRPNPTVEVLQHLHYNRERKIYGAYRDIKP